MNIDDLVKLTTELLQKTADLEEAMRRLDESIEFLIEATARLEDKA